MANSIIIGNGPAGVSAGIYLQRANINTTLISKDLGTLGKIKQIENYYGFAEPISGKELAKAGIAQAKRLGCKFITDEVISLSFEEKFIVKTSEMTYTADAVLIATGSARNTPKIPGIKELEGSGVSYCAVCDAFFYRKKAVAVIGSSAYALHEAKTLLPLVQSVTILTNGEELGIEIPKEIGVDKRKITALNGDSALESVSFETGDPLELSGAFIAIGVASSSDLARKIGAEINNNDIAVNEKMATNVPGLYAAGDCVGGMLQIAKAVYEGAQAAFSMIQYLRK